MIETKHLTKKFGDFVAVDDLNLSIEKGELFSLLGLNGAGKTTRQTAQKKQSSPE